MTSTVFSSGHLPENWKKLLIEILNEICTSRSWSTRERTIPSEPYAGNILTVKFGRLYRAEAGPFA